LEWALAHAALSSYEPGTYASQRHWAEQKRASPVRVQWDPRWVDHSCPRQPLRHPDWTVRWGRRPLSWPMDHRYHRRHLAGREHSPPGQLLRPRRPQAEIPNEQAYPLPDHIARISASHT